MIGSSIFNYQSEIHYYVELVGKDLRPLHAYYDRCPIGVWAPDLYHQPLSQFTPPVGRTHETTVFETVAALWVSYIGQSFYAAMQFIFTRSSHPSLFSGQASPTQLTREFIISKYLVSFSVHPIPLVGSDMPKQVLRTRGTVEASGGMVGSCLAPRPGTVIPPKSNTDFPSCK